MMMPWHVLAVRDPMRAAVTRSSWLPPLCARVVLLASGSEPDPGPETSQR